MGFSPCIGSGYCCAKVLCPAGSELHGMIPGPCPSLVWDEKANRHWCGLLLSLSDDERDKLEAGLAVGVGCCSSLNSWRREPLRDRTRG